jgi:hypothetical protein
MSISTTSGTSWLASPLPLDPHRLAGSHDDQQPCGQGDQLNQRGRRVPAEQRAEPGKDAEPGHRRGHGGYPVAADNRSAVGDDQRQPDRPLGIAEHSEEQDDPEHQGQHGHRIQPPGGKHQRRSGDNCGRPGIERVAARLALVGQERAHQEHHGQRYG